VATLKRDPELKSTCSVRYFDDDSIAVAGVHPLAALTGAHVPDVSAFEGLNVMKVTLIEWKEVDWHAHSNWVVVVVLHLQMGSITAMHRGVIAATNVQLGKERCHFIVVGTLGCYVFVVL